MKWSEICKKYGESWVLLDEVRVDDVKMEIIEGAVLFCDADEELVFKKALELKPKKFAIEFTGAPPENLAFAL